MKTALIAVSEKGAALARILASRLEDGARMFVYAPYAGEGQTPFDKVPDIAQRLWPEYEGLVFLCASGIAVRAVAPLVESKYKDPAIVVSADNGAYVISLLSGHEGGANELARTVAAAINGTPVITTASDSSPSPLPRNLIAGIGCRRGIREKELSAALAAVFGEHRLSLFRLRCFASIDIKKDEEGLLALADTSGVPLTLFSAEQLNTAAGVFSASDFVKKVTGTDNVCERAAMLASSNRGRIIVPRQPLDGITIAVCEAETSARP